ncbi:hypothetical protein, partial [Mycobacterium kansasii]|uniref:hypothetical protein n=1 Tax=Mycobacterium kansasii TaxID=1768 RepID=UPI001CA4B9CA
MCIQGFECAPLAELRRLAAPSPHTRRPGGTLGALAAHSAPWRHTRRPGGTLGALAAHSAP